MKKIFKASQVAAILAAIGLGMASGPVLANEAKPVPQDGKEAKVVKFENLNNYRYCEVFLIGGSPGDLHAAFYNTTDRNTQEEAHNSCPDDMWAKIDKAAIAKKFNLLGVFKNGPRFWMYDWLELPVGAEQEFNGLKARWMGEVKLPKGFGKEGSTFYKTTTVHRKSKQGYNKGTTIFILDDPDGTPWVMQAYSHIIDPSLKHDDLKNLGEKLKLPEGWKYRVKVLDQDFGIGAINGVAHVTQDNLENTYNACFEVDGQTNCTFKP